MFTNLRIRAALIAVVLAAVGTFGVAAPASATSAPYMWKSVGAPYPWACPNIGCNGNIALEANGTPLYVYCYADGPSFNGNYWTNRWFWAHVYSYSGARYDAWITASEVYSQSTVGHC